MNSNELKFTHDKMHLFLKLLFLDNFRLLKKFSKQYRKFSYILNSVSHNIKNLYNHSTAHTTKKLTLVRCCRLNCRLHLDSYQFFCCCPSSAPGSCVAFSRHVRSVSPNLGQCAIFPTFHALETFEEYCSVIL